MRLLSSPAAGGSRHRLLSALVLVLTLGAFAPATSAASVSATAATTDFFTNATHTNNWAILVDTSRYWFNYRHVANTLSFYRTVKRLGIPDSRIILMLADDFACDARNAFSGEIYGSRSRKLNLYGDDIEVDYRGYEVTPENLLRVLTNRHPIGTPRSKRALTDANSNVLLYLTGHGGDEFLKFQDQTEILSKDIADALHQMKQKKRYHELLFIAETCQASTMSERFYSPDILAIGSSAKGENSLSHSNDDVIGLSVIDRFTFHTLEFMENVDVREKVDSRRNTMDAWFASLTKQKVRSTAEPVVKNYGRDLRTVPVTDFFGSATRAVSTTVGYPAWGGSSFDAPSDEGDASSRRSEKNTGGEPSLRGYAEANEFYAPVDAVLAGVSGGWNAVDDRSRRSGEVFQIPPERPKKNKTNRNAAVAYVGCVFLMPLTLAASRAAQKYV